MKHYQIIENPSGVTEVPGFLTAGVPCDVRELSDGRLDLALVVSKDPVSAAGVFTRNRGRAACVLASRETLQSGNPVHGVVANSGNANAWTGTRGMTDANSMQALAAEACGLPEHSMLVCSTGRIGRALPMKNVRAGIKDAAGSLAATRESGLNAADAILTTDTRRKPVAVRVPWKRGAITIGGFAKGAGMIEPNLATMLAFIATDAAISPSILRAMLKRSVNGSFNAITVDGDMSTNDTVLLFANGAAGLRVTRSEKTLFNRFSAALDYVCGRLAYLLVSDGERITKVVEVSVRGTRSARDAEKVARAVGNSLLVKTSWYGDDPNWGRIVDAVGYAGVPFAPEKFDMAYREFAHDPKVNSKQVPVLKSGSPVDRNLPAWRKIVAQSHFSIVLNLNLGKAAYRLLSTDLTEEYVNFNKAE